MASITPLPQVPTCPVCGTSDSKTVKKRPTGWYCFRCKRTVPSVEGPQGAKEPISDEFVEASHRRLCANPAALEWLREQRHIPLDVVKSERLGVDGRRLLIPIPHDEDWVNIRCVDMTTGRKKPYDTGRSVQLYPGTIEPCEQLLICEGELDRLVALGLGFPACSGTGGASVFYQAWAEEIREKADNVVIVYDVDHAGKTGARMVATRLIEAGMHATRIKALVLPLSGKKDDKDLTDWVKRGGTGEQLAALIKRAKTWEAFEHEPGEIPQDAPRRTLAEASNRENAREWSIFEGSVVALLTDAYQLPTRVALHCTEDQGKLCGTCAMPGYKAKVPPGEAPKVDLDTTTDLYVEHIGSPKKDLRAQILGAIGLPSRCPSAVVDELETIPVQEGRIGEPLRIDAEHRATDRAAIFVNLEDVVEPNKEYEMLGKFLPHPRDQIITAIIHRATGVDQFVEHFEEKPMLLRPLRRLKRLGTKVQRVLDDAAEVTRIRGRDDMHLMILLSRLSTLYLHTGESDTPERGWLDVAIIGDTAEGKSEAMLKLNEWTTLGNVIALKRATTRAGLFGGVVQERKKPVISWGVYPRHDRRWLGLDEFHSSNPDLISAMTDARSSGKAQVFMANVTATTSCRVRLCWGANPRSEMPVAAHAYGYDTIEQAFKRLEDIRRLDAAMVVAKGEVSEDERNCTPGKIQLWTRERAEHLELRAWAQRGVDVSHLLDAGKAHRGDFLAEYDGVSPLVEPNSLVLKILRLAVALANLVAEEPTVEHVEYVTAWLHRLYGSDTMGLKTLADLERSRRTLGDEDQVVNTLRMTGDLRATAEVLLLQSDWTIQDLKALATDPGVGGHLVALLVRNRALVRHGGVYRKSPAMVALLKKVLKPCP